MSNLLEFLFCPVHGVFRPDNFALVWAVTNNALISGGFYLRKIGVL